VSPIDASSVRISPQSSYPAIASCSIGIATSRKQLVLAITSREARRSHFNVGTPFHAGRPRFDPQETHIFPPITMADDGGHAGSRTSVRRNGVAICYETEIPSLPDPGLQRREVILCPRHVFGSGFWRVRHCAQPLHENQIYLFIAARSATPAHRFPSMAAVQFSPATSVNQMASLPRRQRTSRCHNRSLDIDRYTRLKTGQQPLSTTVSAEAPMYNQYRLINRKKISPRMSNSRIKKPEIRRDNTQRQRLVG